MHIYSELDMADSFANCLKSNCIRRLPEFDFAYREVICQQGVADFVGLTSNGLLEKYKFDKLSSVDSCSQILSLLKMNSGRTFEYILKQTSLPESSLNRLLKEMLNNGYIAQNGKSYFRSIPDVSSQVNVWAFELKLSNWKRAIFQALQYKAFANYSVVVFPFEKANLLEKNIHYFKDLNVGVLLFNLQTKNNKWLFYPKKEHPISRWHSFFLIGKITNISSEENLVLCDGIQEQVY